MKLRDYLRTSFPTDLRKLNFEKPNSVMLDNLQDFRIDKYTVYFGGQNWDNIENDIKRIHPSNLENFFVCLFTITVIDVGLFTYYKDSYEVFRSKTMYPKFGWAGFGPHYENPKQLLTVPLTRNLVDFKKTAVAIDDYTDLFVTECDCFFNSYLPTLNISDFIKRLIKDPEFQLTPDDKGSIYELIYSRLNDYSLQQKNKTNE